MPYILKNGIESFEVVDGPFAGKKFEKGKAYAEVPPQEKKKFEEVKAPGLRSSGAAPDKAAAQTSPARGSAGQGSKQTAKELPTKDQGGES